MSNATNAPVASHHGFARVWAVAMRWLQPPALVAEREALVSGLHGVVVEVGSGTGSMFGFYPETVERVIAIEPEPYLRAQAQTVAAHAPRPIEVQDGSAEALPVADGSADAVVFCLVLCSVNDQAAALAEARRVLRPGGVLRYYEHVAEPRGSRARRRQEWLDRTGLWPRVGGGCHVARETGAAIRAAGFVVDAEAERTMGPRGAPVRLHLRGTARAA